MKRKLRIKFGFLRIFALLIVGVVIACGSYYYVVTAGTTLDQDKLKSHSATAISLLDSGGQTIDTSDLGGGYATYDSLQQHTIDAFVSVEDKRFFEHNGVDYIRIAGAIKNNILHPSHKQGGSTITQQVIKNTMLDSQKTMTRKLKEIKLARALEKDMTKQEIMEIYLNSIYFGNGCYGIDSASKYYFGVDSSALSIAQSAMLAGTINAPSVYDPVDNFDRADARKLMVLSLMKKNGKISESEYARATIETITIEKSGKKYYSQYYKGVISEACRVLKISENELLHAGYSISTYFDPNVQNLLENEIESGNYLPTQSAKLGAIVLDNQSCGVIAFAGSSGINLLSTYRQPGSAIKPILVYGPAFESKKFSPASIVTDEPINIDGYCPENASKNYVGQTSVRYSIEKSLNIPAVKMLNSVGLNYSKNFAKNMGINFEKSDNNLALALGGFTKGTTIKQLADAYMCYANGGKYISSAFIKEINLNGNIVYSNSPSQKQVASPATAFLITDCLKGVAKTGTAKRLATLGLNVASKTGTVGSTSGNTDAYNVTYSTEHTAVCWLGSNDQTEKLPSNASGATYPTLFIKSLLVGLYSTHQPADFVVPENVNFVGISKAALKNGNLERDDNSLIKDYFISGLEPPLTNGSELDVTLEILPTTNGYPKLNFCAERPILYQILRSDGQNLQILRSYQYQSGEIIFEDTTAKNGKIYEYYVVANFGEKSQESNKIKLLVT